MKKIGTKNTNRKIIYLINFIICNYSTGSYPRFCPHFCRSINLKICLLFNHVKIYIYYML